MKKALLFLCISLFIGKTTTVNAQCYGVVTLDQSSAANGNSSFTISTTFANELIMISYDGWPGPSAGPITVDGNPATFIAQAIVLPAPPGNSGQASTWAYSAPAAGVHNIVCSEPGFFSPYYINFASSFYCAGGTTPLTVASLTSSTNTIPCNNGGSITGNITTTIPNSMIYCNAEYNEVTSATYSISWTGATFIDDTHIGYGIEASSAAQRECATSAYAITATNAMPNYNTSAFCGGLTIVLVDIPPTPATSCFSSIATPLNPTCGNNNGDISIATVGGAPPYTYAWTPAVTTTASASNLSAGTYTIIVSDAACQDTTITITLTTSGPTGIANMTVGEKCFGDCNATATETITGGVPPYTYSWTPSGQTTATATGLCAQTYTFTATDNIGCTGTATVNVTQPTLLTAADAPTNALCNGGTGSIIVTPAGGTAPYTYAWNPSAQTNATATGLTAGTYTVTVTDNNGCTATASATITQPAALSVAITGPATLCLNGTGTLTATTAGGTAPYTYAWSPGNTSTSSTASITLTATTTYSALVTDVNGCTTTGTFTVTLENPGSITLTATKPSICEGLSTTLSASGTNLTGAFTWQPGNLTGPVVSVTPTVTTTYTVSVPTYCGIATSTITVNVNALPITAFGTDNASGCYPFCVQFKNLSTSASGSIVQWVWALGNGDTISSQNPIYCYPNSGSYDVTLTTITDSGCSSTLNVANYINVYSHPNASFTMSPQPTTIINSDIQFTDKSTDAYGIAYWSWNFGVAGNDTLSSLQNPSYKYWDTGTYCPTEVVMNIHGCTDSVTNCLEISPLFEMYIPSSFTPNGDGRNDVFLPIGKDVKSFEMYVYDRWGMQLYHTTDIYTGWNGTVKGGSTVCQEDTYVYVINAFDNKNQKHSYIGAVNLVK